MSDRIRRHETAIEVDSFDLRISGEHLEGAAHRFDGRGIVSRADDDPGSCGKPL